MREISRKKFKLMAIFKREPQYKTTLEYLREWTFENGFDDKLTPSTAARRQDLQGRIFQAGIVVSILNTLIEYDFCAFFTNKDNVPS